MGFWGRNRGGLVAVLAHPAGVDEDRVRVESGGTETAQMSHLGQH